MNYYSVSLTTSNENGDREIEITHHRTILDWFLARPARKRSFVQERYLDTIWWNKETGGWEGEYWDEECQKIAEFFNEIFSE